MSSGLKKYPMSEIKRDRLRRNGVVPFSLDMMTFAIVLSFSLGVCFIAKRYVDGCFLIDISETRGLREDFAQRLNAGLFELFFPFVALLLLVIVFVGGLQTRGLVTFKALKFDFGRVFKFWDNSFAQYSSRLVLGTFGALKQLLWFCFILLVSAYTFPRGLLGNVNASLGSYVLQVGEFFLGLLVASVVFSFILACISRIVTVLAFGRLHMMTRSEIEAELREAEASSQVAAALRNIRDSD